MCSLCLREKALQLQNFEPDIEGGYKKILGTTKFNSNICPQVSASTERVVFTAIFNDVVLAGRGGSIHRASSGSGSWTSTITSLGTPTQNYEHRLFNFDGTDKIIITTGTSNPQILNSSFSTSVLMQQEQLTFKFVEVFKNHIFFSGDASNKQQLVLWGLNRKLMILQLIMVVELIKVDTEIVGLKSFRDTLFIFGKDKIFKLTGSSSSNFAIQACSLRNIGCVDGKKYSRTLQVMLYFLAP